MKYLFSIVCCLIVTNILYSQYIENCLPKDWIVVGEGVNFRGQPNTNSSPIGQLKNGESLVLIENDPVIKNSQRIYLYNSWLNVKRVSTGESGYVFGKYIKPQEMAYSFDSDCDRLQNGNWYGIYQDGTHVMVGKSNPTLKEIDKGYMSIQSDNAKHRILICSQNNLKEGIITGRLYTPYSSVLSIGMHLTLLPIENRNFSLICTGEVELNDNIGFIRKNERIFFIIEEIVGSKSQYIKQELTDCILKFGEGGYQMIFAGDLNNDGIPEIIFSEADNHSGVMYYFMSNKEHKLELRSLSFSGSKC